MKPYTISNLIWRKPLFNTEQKDKKSQLFPQPQFRITHTEELQLTMKYRSQNPFQYKIKLIIDKFSALLFLLILSPLLLLIAIAIKINSNGPFLFKQKRLGFQGKEFIIYKFRTMNINAKDLRNPDGSTYNSDNDPRLTKVGRILRVSSLDEIPQLINILKGEMSIIGPRPDLPEFYMYYDNHQIKKLDVLPGITGLAQINGRNEIPHSERIDFDIKYIKNYSLILDLRIAIKTFTNIIRKKGVYASNYK